MDTKVNYTLVGLFVIVLGMALLGVIVWLSNLGNNQKYDHYVVYMNESVSGLTPQASVSFNGVRVGQVSAIRLNKNNPQQVRLLLDVKLGTPINKSTIATLKSMGITGVAYVGLSATKAHAPHIPVLAGNKYPIIPSKPSLLETLSDALKESADHIATLSMSIQKLVSQKNQKAITKSLDNIQKLTNTLAKNDGKLNSIITKVALFSGNMASASQSFPKTMVDIQRTLKQLRDMSLSINAAGKNMNKTLDSSHVLVQNFSEQVMPETMNVLQKLGGIATHLQGLSAQLQANPSMLIRGKSPAQPGPGEAP
jgi:phospholipid/cholesterol/gamma-HCH transport system substrate-binding protein